MAVWLWLLCMGGAHAADPEDRFIAPVRAGVLMADRIDPPPDDAPWQTVSLPDNWTHRGVRPDGLPAWYRVEFEVPEDFADQAGWSLYLPYLYYGGQFFLNGKFVAQIAETNSDRHVKWERPHLLPLPHGDLYGNGLHAGRNVLHLRIDTAQVTVSMTVPRITLGPGQDLQAVYEQRLFLIRTVAQFTSGACFVTAVLVLFIWLRRRSEVLYGIFGLTTLMWGIRTLTFVIETLPPAQWALWRLCYQAATGGFVVTMALFSLRTAGLRRPVLERLLIAYGLLGPVILAVGGARMERWVGLVWTGGFMLVAFLIVSMVCLAAWRQRTGTAYALMASVLLAVLAAGHDYFLLASAPWMARLFPEWTATRIFVLAFAANAVLLVMGSILANRFITVLRDLEALNQTLDRRVAEREAVIEQNYQRLVDLEGQRQAAEERQRIMQDMHDGLGAQLFSSLSRSERADLSQQEMSDALRGCIAEMRLAIDSLSTSGDDFEATFSDFRYRWEPQLSALGIQSQWLLERTPDTPGLTPHNGLQVLRVLQEALTNVLKHSGATKVQVRLAWVDGLFQAQVSDDGVGLQGPARAEGRGLQNMRTRAGRLGGTMALESAAGHTLVTLTVPAQPLA